MIFDTHSHIYDSSFDDDRDEVLRRAKQLNVNKILVPGDNLVNSLKAISLAKNEGIYAGVGIHPTECHQENLESSMKALEKMVRENEKVKAIAEIGLDYYWEKEESLKKEQQDFFVAQLLLADKLNLPVAIHARDSIEDVYKTLANHYPRAGVIMHCYSSSSEMMHKFVDLGCYISLGGPVTYKNALTPKKVAQEVPLDRLLVETDAPYLSPVPHRGKRNEPSFIIETIAEIAHLRKMLVSEIEDITYQNACRILRIKE